MYQALVATVADSLSTKNGALFISFTTDAWTTPQCSDSLRSMTAHWLDAEFNKHSAMLHASHMIGQNAGAHIAQILQNMVQKWDLTGRVHVMMRDNASSMIKAKGDTNITSFGCVSHTLQLSVIKALKVQRAVEDVVANCRCIATHFSQSSLAKEKLEEIQRSQRIPEHDVSTK